MLVGYCLSRRSTKLTIRIFVKVNACFRIVVSAWVPIVFLLVSPPSFWWHHHSAVKLSSHRGRGHEEGYEMVKITFKLHIWEETYRTQQHSILTYSSTLWITPLQAAMSSSTILGMSSLGFIKPF